MVERKFTPLTDELHDYVVDLGAREDAILARIREQAAAMGDVSKMQVAPDQGALLTMLARLTGARRAIEVGTSTGYSAICIARGLGLGGELIALELDPDRAQIAQRNFADTGVAERIEVRVGPAVDSLTALETEGSEPYDLAFIDADKVGYRVYVESCFRLLREGGLLVVDNVLWDGGVVDPDPDDDAAVAIDRLNRELAGDERFDISIVPIADGITLLRKR